MGTGNRNHALGSIYLPIELCFPKEQLSRYHANPLGKKIIRVDTMPNSLLKKINNLRSIYHAF
jgi:hypothetical protein